MKNTLRTFAALALVVMSVACSDDNPVVQSGTTGPLKWELTENGTLTISGTGAMLNYDIGGGYSQPWPDMFKIKTVNIADGVTRIGNCAFTGCGGLTSITIPNSVTSIGNRAFDGGERLTSITIPNSVTSIGDDAYRFCTRLENITISNNVTSIGAGAFNTCISLTSITIPNSVTNIGDAAFVNCNNLTSVTVMATTPPTLGTTNFGDTDDTLYVPKGCLAQYNANPLWAAAFTEIVEQK